MQELDRVMQHDIISFQCSEPLFSRESHFCSILLFDPLLLFSKRESVPLPLTTVPSRELFVDIGGGSGLCVIPS